MDLRLYQPVVKVGRMREREIFGQIKADNRWNVRDRASFSNAALAEKARSGRGASFAMGCNVLQSSQGAVAAYRRCGFELVPYAIMSRAVEST